MNRQRLSFYYMSLITFIGGVLCLTLIPTLPHPQDILRLIILLLFLYVIEQFPMPLKNGKTSLSFPILFTIYVLYGLPMAGLVFYFAVLFANTIQRRPICISLFNPAQLVISFSLSAKITHVILQSFFLPFSPSQHVFIKVFLIVILFYLFNNIFIDLFLIVHPKKYSFKNWGQKTLTEGLMAFVSILYIFLMALLGTQHRGTVDFVTYFFFFSPLAAASLLGSIIVKLQKEKNRLNALFSITSKMNKGITADNWLGAILEELMDFLNFDASILFVVNRNEWRISHVHGIKPEFFEKHITQEVIKELKKIKGPQIITRGKATSGPIDHLFTPCIHSFAYSPLIVENEWVGMWVIGSASYGHFNKEDMPYIKLLANQLSMVKKARRLIAEQENNKIFEERNRIAREIHDGTAQALAGVILNLETSQKKFHSKPEEANQLIKESIGKLRLSLTQLRESIYALRPNPAEHISLIEAIKAYGNQVQKEHNIKFNFQIKGKVRPLSEMSGKILYEIGIECIRNSVKHAHATEVHVLIHFRQNQLLFKVKDNGVGFSLFEAMVRAKTDPHFGILNMNDLADKLGASLQIDSRPGSGTEIKCLVPHLEQKGGNTGDKRYVSG